jgi:ferrous iron transport protein B
VLRGAWSKGVAFLREAGSVIFVATVALWALLSFPQIEPGEGLSEQEQHAAQLEASFAGDLGKALEPALEPLGFDWRIGVGLIGAFAAREVFVSTMAVVYGLSEDEDEGSAALRDRIRAQTRADGTRVYTPLVCFSLMIFFALACQCMSTLAAIKREAGSWRWMFFAFGYMTVLAWIASFLVYQGGRLLGFE